MDQFQKLIKTKKEIKKEETKSQKQLEGLICKPRGSDADFYEERKKF